MATEALARKRDITLWGIVAALIGVLLVQWAWATHAQVESIPFGQSGAAEIQVNENSIQPTWIDTTGRITGASHRSLQPD